MTGEWTTRYQNNSADPPAQMTKNRYAMRDFLRRLIKSKPRIEVDAAIAFVNARGFAGDARPTEVEPEQLIWADNLDSIDSALLRFMNRGRPGVLM